MPPKTLISLALAGCTLGLLSSCDKAQKEESQVVQEAPPIKVFPLREQELRETKEWFGYLKGVENSSIHPQISGFILSQPHDDGDFVNKGDTLFLIDPVIYKAQLEQAEATLQLAQAELSSAQASLAKAQLDVERNERLFAQNATTAKALEDARQELAASKASVAAAKANIKQNEAAVAQARINLSYTVIRAPFAGLANSNVAPGELVNPNTELLNLTSVDPIRVDFAMPSAMLSSTFKEVNTKGVSTMPPFEIILENGTTYPMKGKIIAVDNKIDENGLISVTGEVENPDRLLHPGFSIRVRLLVNQYKGLLVPQDAIRKTLRNNAIIVLDKEQKPVTIPVEILGEYPVQVSEANGYKSVQRLVSVAGYGEDIRQIIKGMGYANVSEVPVVADKNNGMFAASIAAANSRLAPADAGKAGKVKSMAFTFKPSADQEPAPQAKEGEEKKAAAPVPPKSNFLVKVAKIVRQDAHITKDWYGMTEGDHESDIRARVTGFLIEKKVQHGQLVQKDEVLFLIDPAPFQAQLEQAQSNYEAALANQAKAQATLVKHQNDYTRNKKLYETSPGAISTKTVTDSKTAVEMAEATLQQMKALIAQAKAAVNQAEINLGYTKVLAPFTGRVGLINCSLGELVGPSTSESLATISSVEPMDVVFDVSGQDVLKSAEMRDHGDSLDGLPPVEIILEDGSLYPHKAKIRSTDNQLNSTKGTLKITARVPNAEHKLRSGMPVKVRAVVESHPESFLVPVRAPMSAQGMDMLILLTPNNQPQMFPIKKGAIVEMDIKGEDGKITRQPMQIVTANRKLLEGQILAKQKVPSLEALILGKNEVKSWEELILKQAKAKDFKALCKDADKLPADTNWQEHFLASQHVEDAREYILKAAKAKDELDMMAHSAGFKSPLAMMLTQMGFKDLSNIPIVVEGSMPAAMVFGANKGLKEEEKSSLRTAPFIYTQPQTVVPSVTATPNN